MFLLDDHEVVRRGVAAALDAHDDLCVVGEAGAVDGAIGAIAAAAPDVVVVDVRLGDGSGIEVCRQVRDELPGVATLVLTSFDDDRAIVDASLAGASAFVLKQIRSTDLVEAIRAVADGRRLLDARAVDAAVRRARNSDEGRLADLSPQERRIFDLIGQGMTNREIATAMFLSEKTVKNYVSNVLAKLAMSRRTEAAALAARVAERTRTP